MASYPSAAKSFTTKNAGDTIQPADVNDCQTEITAIESDLIAGLPISRGGTGQTTLAGHGVVIGNAGSAVNVTGAGTANQVLTSNGASADPTFQTWFTVGTWTPVIGGAGGVSGQSYTTQFGDYTKMGRTVVATFLVALSAKGTITGNLQLQGLPFTSFAMTGANNIPCGAVEFGNLNTNWVAVHALIQSAATTALIVGSQAAAATDGSPLATGDLTNTSFLRGTLIYQASS